MRPFQHRNERSCYEQGPGKGKVKDVAGKVQREAGEATGSEEQQAKGLKNQAEGKAQKGYGEAKETARDIGKDHKE